MRVLAFLVLAFFLLGSSVSSVGAAENFKSVGDLLNACEKRTATNPTERFQYTVCMSYVRGAGDMQMMNAALLNANSENGVVSPFFCEPEGVSVQQSIRIFTKYANDHPETQHLHMIIGFIEAMQEAFPCPAN